MENASKALIIAGAILLSILIIALGVYIFNIAKGSMDTKQVDTLARNSFNSQFEQYDGRCIGSSVRDLIGNMISAVADNKDSDDKLPDITYIDAENKGPKSAREVGSNGVIVSNVENTNITAMNKLKSAISSTHYYYVKVRNNPETSLVDMVYICYNESDIDQIDESK